MPKVAEAECATCHYVMPKTEMRQVKVSRIAGYASSTSNSESRGPNNPYPTRYGRSRSNSAKTRIDRVWVCNGCKAPRSDGWFTRLLVNLAIVAAVLFFGANYLLKNGNQVAASSPSTTETVAPINPDASSRTEERPAEIEPAKVPPPVVFAPPKEVAQPIAPAPKDYPRCSDTVTDQCVSK